MAEGRILMQPGDRVIRTYGSPIEGNIYQLHPTNPHYIFVNWDIGGTACEPITWWKLIGECIVINWKKEGF